MIAKVRVQGKRQSYLLRTGCLGPVGEVRGQRRRDCQSTVDRFGETSHVGRLLFPAPDNHRDGSLAWPLTGDTDGDIDSAWPWFWVRAATRQSKCSESC